MNVLIEMMVGVLLRLRVCGEGWWVVWGRAYTGVSRASASAAPRALHARTLPSATPVTRTISLSGSEHAEMKRVVCVNGV